MSMTTLLFVGLGILTIVIIIGVWYYWERMVRGNNEEEEFERRLARLNERQTQRFSDDELTSPPTNDAAWDRMVQQGRRPERRERYGGRLEQRTGERRRRNQQSGR